MRLGEKIMAIKMKCMHKQGNSKCEETGTHNCDTCHTAVIYCDMHTGMHYVTTKHNLVPIEKAYSKIKQQVKACISRISQDSSCIIAEITRTSMNTITQLKQVSKNLKDVDELMFHVYDPKKISLLVEQVQTQMRIQGKPLGTL